MITPTFRINIVFCNVLLFPAALAIALAFSLVLMQECAARNNDSAIEVLQIPAADGSGRSLLVNVMRPSGSGPFPLAVINHGSPPVASKRPEMSIPTYFRLSRWLVAQGYAVALPLRRGYGQVGGRWDETYGSCERPDFKKAGLETARDIEAVISGLVQKDFVQKQRIVVIGQSAGGWGALALASLNPKNVIGYVNFAGGRGGHRNNTANENCAPDKLVEAALEFGKTARRPSLWIYAENDSFFALPLARQMHDRYQSAGGKATLHILPPVENDGHRAISDEKAFALWSPVVGRFLKDLE